MGKTFGLTTVDWEQRVDIDRLRRERLARIKGLLAESDIGALLCFDMANIRYITATHIGTWAMDKLARFCLLAQDDDPIVWDFGSAARHHEQYCPWLEARGLLGEPVGVDVVEPAVLFALQDEGIQVVDGQQLMQGSRVIKSVDEIILLETACMMVDAAYEHLYREMRPGMRE